MERVYLRLLIMCATVYAIRLFPFLLLRREIKSRFFRSFLHYVPYVTLAVMTFPAIVTATGSMAAGAAALAVGIAAAWMGGNLIVVATCCCIAALLFGLI